MSSIDEPTPRVSQIPVAFTQRDASRYDQDRTISAFVVQSFSLFNGDGHGDTTLRCVESSAREM